MNAVLYVLPFCVSFYYLFKSNDFQNYFLLANGDPCTSPHYFNGKQVEFAVQKPEATSIDVIFKSFKFTETETVTEVFWSEKDLVKDNSSSECGCGLTCIHGTCQPQKISNCLCYNR